MSAADILASTPPALDERDAVDFAIANYGFQGKATLLVSERDQNFKLEAADGSRCLLKIANAAEDLECVRFENAALRHVASVAPEIPVPRVISTSDGNDITELRRGADTHYARVISWLPGRPLRDIESGEAMRRQLGSLLAQLGRALRGFFHPSAGKQLLWDIRHAGNLGQWLEHIEDIEIRDLCDTFIARFNADVLPRLGRLRSQVIHNDLNASNVLVSTEQHPAITGVLDFGDMIHGPLICDVAVGAAYQLNQDEDPLAGALQFIEAYHRITPLEAEEVELLFDLIVARLVTTVTVTAWRASRYPENRDYILRNAHAAISQLRTLSEMSRSKANSRLAGLCRPVQRQRSSPTADAEILTARRRQLLGSSYRLFYERPLHAVRGEGVWLYDSDGKAYLDAYNNVPLVGHCHPEVVDALASQAATLNTHTRYLHETVLDYAERLLGMFPAALDRVMFGCTGSEANELALRVARAYTGNEGVIVSNHAYHGNTTAVSQLSPSYESPEAREDWVETIAPPDTYRPEGANAESITNQFLTDLDAAIDRLASRGIQPAALLLDAGFTSDGMYIAPPGCLARAADKIRSSGGIYIADEVQSGFARFGETLWGFELHGIAPEIVTLGKPIGNGHPLAATVLRHDVLDVFSDRGRYFNTFGGNPVSAAVGLAVLNVFHNDKLQVNSRTVGAYLHEGLAELSEDCDVIGDVRGSGLFAGVEIVNTTADEQSVAERTARIVNAMRERGVLISMIGPRANVLKVRPPLPFSRRNVDELIDTLQGVLK